MGLISVEDFRKRSRRTVPPPVFSQFSDVSLRFMARKRRKQGRRKQRGSGWPYVLILVAVVAVAIAYWRSPVDRREEISKAWSGLVDQARKRVVDLTGTTDSLSPPGEPAGRFYSFAGIPRPDGFPHSILVLTNRGYLSGYCEEIKSPVWVSYRVFQLAAAKSMERPGRFLVDERTRTRVAHGDYTHSGYDRGHLAPNYAIGTRYGREAQIESFLMSNIVPQKPRLNRTLWRFLEEREANEYALNFEEVWVLTGPIFDANGTRLSSGVEIPEAFYKILLDDEGSGQLRVIAFRIDQDVTGTERLSQFLTTVDAIEAETGLDFLSDLEDGLEDEVESLRVDRVW
jgi:endonuclease G, mitochondrial